MNIEYMLINVKNTVYTCVNSEIIHQNKKLQVSEPGL